MALLTLDVPDELMIIPQTERNHLIRVGLQQAVFSLVNNLKQEIQETKKHIHIFENRYQTTFSDFESSMFSKLDTLEAHEDYNDWFFWESVLSEKKKLLSQLEQVTMN